MKLFPLFKSMSRTVHEEHRQQQQQPYVADNNVDEPDGDGASTCTLTVWRRSLVMSCDGFTVIDSSGNLVYRVDNYLGRPKPLVLMDASGKSLLAMSRRKRLGLVLPEWMIYEELDGDESSCVTAKGATRSEKKPICCVRKSIMSNMSRNGGKVVACVFLGGCCDGRCDYVIRGSYASRSCKVSDRRGRVVAEIKRKEATGGAGVCFGDDVFLLVVYPNFQPVFAMALVLLLDQMF